MGNGYSPFPNNWNSISHPPGAAQHTEYLRQEAEVSFQNGTVGAVEEFQEAGGREMKGVTHGKLGEELLLLCLVVQDFCLWVTEGKRSKGFRISL